MKIALSVDALAPSLTGIGRYTWELVKGLQQHSAVDELGFYRHGRAVADPAIYLAENGKAPSYWPGQKWWQRRCYRQLVGSSFCHGTNYFLPPEAETGVITVHDLSVFKYPETHPIERIREFEKLLPASIEKARHIITDSAAVRSEVIEYFGVAPAKVSVVYLGREPKFKPAVPAQNWPFLAQNQLQPHSYSLCVSTLEPRKQIDQLLCSYQMLPLPLRQAFPLVLAGADGWLSADLMLQIDSAKAQGWLKHLGYVNELQLTELYQGASLFIYPSLYEGFGLPVVEAMSCALPVLISTSACLIEVAGDAAEIAVVNEPAAFASQIKQLLLAPERRAAMAAASLQRAQKFSWAQCVQDTLSIYSQMESAA